VAGLAALAAAGPGAAEALARALRATLLGAATDAPLPAAAAAATAGVRAALPLLLAPAAAAGAVALLHVRPAFTLAPLQPRLDRLDPLKGLRRIFSVARLADLLIGLARAAVLLALLAGWLADHGRGLGQLPRLLGAALPRGIPLGELALRFAVAALAFGLLDLALARRRHRRALMMTRDEVRREAREDDGDPARRAERRSLHRALVEAGPVSGATVVIVNPTHLAVALRHERGKDEAPRVLAKGQGASAARIRSAARRAGVPIVRDVPLARALARLVDVGEEIPPDLYEAAAGVLIHVYGNGGRR
jgi:type III secretion protein U